MRPFVLNVGLATLLLILGHVPSTLQQGTPCGLDCTQCVIINEVYICLDTANPVPDTTSSLPTSSSRTSISTSSTSSVTTSPSPTLTSSPIVPTTTLSTPDISQLGSEITQLGADSPEFSYLPADAWVKNTSVPDCAISRGGIRSSTKVNSTISFPLTGSSFSIRTIVGPTPAKFFVSFGNFTQQFNTSATADQPVCRDITFTLPPSLQSALAKRDNPTSIDIQHGGCANPENSDCPYNHDGATFRRSTPSAAVKLHLPGSYVMIAGIFVYLWL